MQPRSAFISHAHADNAIADRYANALRERGVDVWYDRSNMPDGGVLSQEIEQQLEQRSAFVVHLTEASARSYWVRLETDSYRALAARDSSRLMLPVKVRPSEIPSLLGGIKWIDATAISFDESIDRIVRALRQSEPQVATELIPSFSSPVLFINRARNQEVAFASTGTINLVANLIALSALAITISTALAENQTRDLILQYANDFRPSIGTGLALLATLATLVIFYIFLHALVSWITRWSAASFARSLSEITYSMDIQIASKAKANLVRKLIDRGRAAYSGGWRTRLLFKDVALRSFREERLSEGESLDICEVEANIKVQRSRRLVLGLLLARAVQAHIEYEIVVTNASAERQYSIEHARVTLKCKDELDTRSLGNVQSVILRYFVNPYLEQPLPAD